MPFYAQVKLLFLHGIEGTFCLQHTMDGDLEMTGTRANNFNMMAHLQDQDSGCRYTNHPHFHRNKQIIPALFVN